MAAKLLDEFSLTIIQYMVNGLHSLNTGYREPGPVNADLEKSPIVKAEREGNRLLP